MPMLPLLWPHSPKYRLQKSFSMKNKPNPRKLKPRYSLESSPSLRLIMEYFSKVLLLLDSSLLKALVTCSELTTSRRHLSTSGLIIPLEPSMPVFSPSLEEHSDGLELMPTCTMMLPRTSRTMSRPLTPTFKERTGSQETASLLPTLLSSQL